MYAKDMILELGDKLGLGKLELDENNTCSLVFDNIHAIDMKVTDDGNEIQIFSPVSIVPEKNREAFLCQLMEANLFGQGTGGSLFSVIKEIDLLFMYRKFRLEVSDYQNFEKGLETFLNYLEAWKKKIETEYGEGDGSTTTPTPAKGPVREPSSGGGLPPMLKA